MGEPQGLDELPCEYEEIDDDYREESDDEIAARAQEERCEVCREEAARCGDYVDCDSCGLTDAEMKDQIPVPVEELDTPPPDDEPF